MFHLLTIFSVPSGDLLASVHRYEIIDGKEKEYMGEVAKDFNKDRLKAQVEHRFLSETCLKGGQDQVARERPQIRFPLSSTRISTKSEVRR